MAWLGKVFKANVNGLTRLIVEIDPKPNGLLEGLTNHLVDLLVAVLVEEKNATQQVDNLMYYFS